MDIGYDGVKFYNATDLSCGHSLEKAEIILKAFDFQEKFANINQIIEYFNITLFFQNDVRLTRWTDEDFRQYKSITKVLERIVAIYFSGINENNFLQSLLEVDRNYIENFWFLINRYKVYDLISEKYFSEIIEKPEIQIYPILLNKDIVDHYGQGISNFLVKSDKSAELLLTRFLVENDPSRETIWFPKELTGEQKEEILLRYIRSNEANPNYLELIAQSQNTSDLRLNDRTKLEARNKYNAFVEMHFSKNQGIEYEVKVTFSKTQKEEVVIENSESSKICYSYSVNWIKENQDFPTLLNNFIYLFEYVDPFFRSQFVCKPAHLGILERMIGVKGKRDYITGIEFNLMHLLFNAQMMGYYEELSHLDIRMESILKWFFEIYLQNEFNAKGFTFSAASDGTTDLEKCKLLASEIDSVLKQFEMFVLDGNINRELFEISSVPIKLASVPSFSREKYIYPNNDICKGSINLLFSDQLGLAYTEKTQDNYMNLYSLLHSETMYLNDFADYQKPKIIWLVEHGCVNISEDGQLFLNIEKARILRDLHENQFSCSFYLDQYCGILNTMMDSGEIKSEASLFSEPEQAFINYILNKAEFSNGLDLRNKYIHGTHSLKIQDHKTDYIELLKIMVLIIIKINEEFCIREDRKSE